LNNYNHTIVALSTPAGVGALGVIRLSGEKAIAIVDDIFLGKKLTKQASHTLHYGKIVNHKKVIDEVVVSLFKNPTSYTGEDVVEISCHGSPYILQKVLELCIAKGAALAKPGEFTLRAFLNGQMDLSQAEAVANLIASDSEANHLTAMQQMRGGFSSEISLLRKRLIKFASLIELELDFGEEDVEFANRSELINLLDEVQLKIKQMTSSFQLGNVIKNGVTTVIAGRPNAGKSTLLNALLNEDRAIVSDIAGTTRDSIEAVLNIKGLPFRLIDTAGIREATDTIEKIGVEKTMEKIRQSAVVVYLFDVQNISWQQMLEDVATLNIDDVAHLIIANKTDLLNWQDLAELEQKGVEKFGARFQMIQAKNKHNIGAVREQLYNLIISNKVQTQHTVVTNARHYEALSRANTELQKVYDGLNNNISGDLLALDIRSGLNALGEITGEVTTDDLLDSIFRDFCIGK